VGWGGWEKGVGGNCRLELRVTSWNKWAIYFSYNNILAFEKKMLSILYKRFEIIGYLHIEKKQCKKEYDSRKLVDCTPSLGLTKIYYKS